MNDWLSTRVFFASLVLFFVSSLTIYHASVYVFSPIQEVLRPQSPPVVFSGRSDFFVCTDLLRTSRASLVFSDFESLPNGWRSLGGSWTITTGGYKGNGLSGVDNNAGPGGSSIYYWDSSIFSYSRLSVSVKVRRSSGNLYMGVSLLQQPTTSSRLYEVSVFVFGSLGYLDIWYFSGRGWTRLYRSAAFTYNNEWLVLYINYSRSETTSTNYISATVYSVGGSVLASGSVAVSGNQYFIPSYVSVSVDEGQAVFDDFVVVPDPSLSPRYVYVEGVPQGFSLSLYDDLDNKVAEASSSGGITRLNVLSDVVVGRGLGGVFRVYDTSGNLCLTKSFTDPIVGSDTYALVAHRVTITFYDEHTRAEIRVLFSNYYLQLPRTTVLNVTLLDLNPYYGGIILYPEESLIQPDLELVLEISNGTESDSLMINGGSPPAEPIATSLLGVSPGIELSISVEASKESSNFSRLYLELIYCVDPQLRGVCVYYPIRLEV